MTWTPPKLTLIYVGIMALMYVALTVNVIRQRWVARRGIGCEDDQKSPLFRAIRVHGNFAEFVPFILLMMALDEMTARLPMMVHIFGITLIFARVCHYLGITKTHLTSWQRAISVLLTNLLLIVLAILLLMKGLS